MLTLLIPLAMIVGLMVVLWVVIRQRDEATASRDKWASDAGREAMLRMSNDHNGPGCVACRTERDNVRGANTKLCEEVVDLRAKLGRAERFKDAPRRVRRRN